jgi:Na+-transporting NADH:ubiquinone oxidoreductase subunit A
MPINKSDVMWYLDPQDVINIGRFLKTGNTDLRKIVALTGSEVKNPKYFEMRMGSNLKDILSGGLTEGNNRIISGNVLNGNKISEDGFLGFYNNQITVIPEGDEPQFFLTEGWLAPGFSKFSLNRSFPSWLMPGKKYTLNTNKNGEERAYVMTGEYEKVFPFDIFPVQLVKSIIVNDIESMENLGIYEVAPEDFALCEYSCTSKIQVQKLVREGLDTIMEEFK